MRTTGGLLLLGVALGGAAISAHARGMQELPLHMTPAAADWDVEGGVDGVSSDCMHDCAATTPRI